MVTTMPQVRQFGPTVINDGNTERLRNGDEAAASR
jgi:hypothetical protein